MPDFISPRAILAAGVLRGAAGAAAGPMHLFDEHMPIADKPDF